MDIDKYLVRPTDTIQTVIAVIDGNKNGIALVVDENGQLMGSITDGDIRRYLLAGKALTEACRQVMHSKPVVARPDTSRKDMIRLIKDFRIRNIPLVDSQNRPLKVITIAELINGIESEFSAVIMAGGEGRRLRPLTENLPKPMISVGGTPLMAQIIASLAKVNIRKIYIAVNYRADVIEDYFKDGKDLGVDIEYLREEKKLGTAGALSLIERLPNQPLLVMNGDVVTKVNFGRLLDFHSQQRCVITMAAIDYHLNIPYGVIDLAGHYVMGLDEKPTKRFLCNAGIYVIEPDIVHLVPKNTFHDMPDLLRSVIQKGLPVATFPIHEYWVDIGQKEDLERVTEDNILKRGE